MLLPVGCANKKRIAREQAEAARRQEIERQQELERQRIQDSIALAQAEAEAIRLREAEQQRIQDSIAQAEAARKAMVQTMTISRMTITLNMQGRQFATPATLRWQRGAGVILSIQPLAGIEMLRAEADEQYVTLIDKINRRYARLTYDELAEKGARTNIDEMDEWIDQHIINRRNEPQLSISVSRAGIDGTAIIYTNSIQTDVRVNMRPTNVDTYKRVTLEQLAGGVL